VDLDAPVPTAAVWISADGDDTQSRFQVTITTLDLLLQEGDGAPVSTQAPSGYHVPGALTGAASFVVVE